MFKQLIKQLNLYITFHYILLTMLYYEEAEVKEYYRKNKEGVKVPYYQVGVKKKSKFSKPKPIGLVDLNEIRELNTFLKNNPIEDKEAEIIKLKEEVIELKKQLNEKKETVESLSSKVGELKEDKIQLQEELLETKDNLGAEKDISKTLLLALYSYEERGYFKGLLNKTPDLAKQILKENPKPIETTSNKN